MLFTFAFRPLIFSTHSDLYKYHYPRILSMNSVPVFWTELQWSKTGKVIRLVIVVREYAEWRETQYSSVSKDSLRYLRFKLHPLCWLYETTSSSYVVASLIFMIRRLRQRIGDNLCRMSVTTKQCNKRWARCTFYRTLRTFFWRCCLVYWKKKLLMYSQKFIQWIRTKGRLSDKNVAQTETIPTALYIHLL